MDLLTTLGPDTVELIIRDEVTAPQGTPQIGADGFPTFGVGGTVPDSWGRPTVVDRAISKSGCSWQVSTGTEDIAGTIVATLEGRGAFPVDADTRALTSSAAVRHGGRLFELTTPGVTQVDGFGRASHVRVYGRWSADVSLGERVLVVAAGRRHDGVVDPDAPPVPLIARAVTAGNATVRFGAEGPTEEADFTVVLDLDAPVRDGDWLIVRGRECRAVVGRQESQWTELRQLVVVARSVGGSGT